MPSTNTAFGFTSKSIGSRSNISKSARFPTVMEPTSSDTPATSAERIVRASRAFCQGKPSITAILAEAASRSIGKTSASVLKATGTPASDSLAAL